MTAVVLGIVIGIVMGLTGAGGGILAVPALVFALGWPLAQAAPVALVAVAGAAGLGAIEGLKRGLVRYRSAAFMAAIGVAMTPLGVKLAAVAPEKVLLLSFAAAMMVVSARMLRQAKPEQVVAAPCHLNPATGRLLWTRRAAATLGAIGASSGFLTGLLGVGGGFLIVPALRKFSDLSMQGIVATSLAVIALVSAGAVVAASLHAHAPPFAVAAPFAGGAAGGMVLGRAGASRLKPAHLQHVFAVVTAIVALGLIVRALHGSN
jgi:hypothetical protein